MFFSYTTLLLTIFLSSLTIAAPITRLVNYDNATFLTSIDLIGCVTGASNTTNLHVTLFAASSGSYVFCVADEGGFADVNPIEIHTVGADVFYPDGTSGLYVIGQSSKTVCLYSNGVNGFHERRF
jgi:hypothetical protein